MVRHIEIQVEFPAVPRGRATRPLVLAPTSWPYVLSGCLALAAALSAAVSLWAPSVLTGPEVTQGNLRGTALAVLAVGVPALVVAMLTASRGGRSRCTGSRRGSTGGCPPSSSRR